MTDTYAWLGSPIRSETYVDEHRVTYPPPKSRPKVGDHLMIGDRTEAPEGCVSLVRKVRVLRVGFDALGECLRIECTGLGL